MERTCPACERTEPHYHHVVMFSNGVTMLDCTHDDISQEELDILAAMQVVEEVMG